MIIKRYIEQVGGSENVTLLRDGLTYRYDEVPGVAEESPGTEECRDA